MHYYKRNLGDYAKKAGRLSMLQHGAYTLLIDTCYDREQFPTEEEAIEWTWASTEAEIEAVRFVLRRFFTLQDSVYVQHRIQEEIDLYHEKSEKNKQIAIERESTKKERARNVEFKERFVQEREPNQEPITNNQEPLTSKVINKLITKTLSSDVDEIFLFWQARLRHPQSKLSPKRKKAIEQALKNGYTVTQLKHAITGLSLSEFHMAEGFDDITYAFRDTNIDKFISEATTPSDERRKKSNVIDFCNTGF